MRPRSVVGWTKAPASAAQKHIGRVFRVGYSSWQDGFELHLAGQRES
jgi:hypothetical protein